MSDQELFERRLRALAFIAECAKNAKTPADLATALASRIGSEFHSFSPYEMYSDLLGCMEGLLDSAEASINPGDLK